MLLPIASLFILLGLALAQTSSTCSPVTPSQPHKVTLVYTNRIPVQTPPYSTVYNAIVTRTVFGVDCKYLAVVMVDDNLPQTGHYTGVTTVDALTVDRVTCIQETAVVTRREVRGYPGAELELRSHETELFKRATLKDNMMKIADKQGAEVPPDAQGLSVIAYSYLVQVNTALFALNLANAGFNMNATCTVLSDPVTQARLYLASINPIQAASIICYAAQYGLYFRESNAQLLSDLVGVIYSIEVKSGWTTSNDVLCTSLESSLSSAGYLGIDADGIRSYVCGASTTTLTSTGSPNATTPASSTTSTASLGTAGTAGTTSMTGTAGSINGTGEIPPFANSTTWSSSALTGSAPAETTEPLITITRSTHTGGQPTGTAAFGTAASSLGGSAASLSFSIVFPNATANINSSYQNSVHVPPSPTSSPYYAVWTTSTTPASRMPQY